MGSALEGIGPLELSGDDVVDEDNSSWVVVVCGCDCGGGGVGVELRGGRAGAAVVADAGVLCGVWGVDACCVFGDGGFGLACLSLSEPVLCEVCESSLCRSAVKLMLDMGCGGLTGATLRLLLPEDMITGLGFAVVASVVSPPLSALW